MKLSIIIPSYNSLGLLQQSLPHLKALLTPGSAEIIVVDNASTDGSGMWLQNGSLGIDHVIYLDENVGFAAACNRGIEQAQAPYILLLNSDAFPQPGALEKLMEYLDSHPRVGIVAPQLVFSDGRWQRSGGLLPSPRAAMLDAFGITSFLNLAANLRWRVLGSRQAPRAANYVDGACMMVRYAMIQQIGNLDERFFFFIEDAEYCQRARQNGWLVHQVPSSKVVHLRGGSSSQKSLEQSTKMRLQSERTFVVQTSGLEGWRRFLVWRRRNYRMRMLLALVAGRHRQYETYKLLWRVYWEQTL